MQQLASEVCEHRKIGEPDPIVPPASCVLHSLILAVANFLSAGHFSSAARSSITRNSATHSLSFTPGPEACLNIYSSHLRRLKLILEGGKNAFAKPHNVEKCTFFRSMYKELTKLRHIRRGCLQPRDLQLRNRNRVAPEYGATPECKDGRKLVDQRHLPVRFPHAKIRERPHWESNPIRLGRTWVINAELFIKFSIIAQRYRRHKNPRGPIFETVGIIMVAD
ncbi:hypothetical protein PR048_016985 [Dryococelus australis]|uniref:Uncharacterized protein n=1 Tax=Dryococelus australis TaxID=614101 RepID=A0ABQ9H886_9NEOP|nr:hypothetical protein PR048_016985 [Dryococelus australis]